MATKTQRFRTATKIETDGAGYCVASIHDNITADEITVKIYSSEKCRFIFNEVVKGKDVPSLIAAGEGAGNEGKRNSEEKAKRDLFYKTLLDSFIRTRDCPDTSLPAPLNPSNLPPPPPKPQTNQALENAVREAKEAHGEGRYVQCVDLAIYAVKVSRAVRNSSMTRDMYELMGDAYRNIGERKYGRSANCYILALKEGENEEGSTEWAQTVRKKLREVGGVRGGASEGEIEAVLSNHKLMGISESWNFNCTGCGECCRTADNILLTPFDLFNLTRSSNLQTNTVKLKRDETFGKALKYMLKDDVPVCYLSPVKSNLGHCHFAFELVKVGGRLLDYKETKEAMKEEEYRPVTADEYNLTEEEELEAMKDLDVGGTYEEKSGDEWEEDDDEEDDKNHELMADQYVPVNVLNSYSKPALGCMLGVEGMPAMCAAYPIANESVWGDFWHGRDEDEEKKLDELQYGEGAREGGNEGWVVREKFVLVENDVCEGFFEEGREKTEAYESQAQLKDNRVVDFLRSGTNLQRKEEEKAWFLSLHKKATCVKINDPEVRKTFIEHIARIWFNFDSLPTARKRPFKSWSRCKKVLQECTDVMVSQTVTFIEMETTRGEKGGARERYIDLLNRLNL